MSSTTIKTPFLNKGVVFIWIFHVSLLEDNVLLLRIQRLAKFAMEI